MTVDWISPEQDAAVVHVRVTPKGGRNAIEAPVEGRLRVRVAAAPADGAANDAARKLIAKAAGVSRSSVELIRGAKAREKSLRVAGVTADALAAKLLERVK